MLSIRKIFLEEYTIDLVQKRNYDSTTKIRQKELLKRENLQINSASRYIEQDIEVNYIKTSTLYCRNSKYAIRYLNRDLSI